MARRVIQSEEFTDDLDGSSAAETVRFAFDGQSYEIDLSRSNKRAFEKLMKPYVQNARKARGGGRSGGRSSTRSSGRGRTSGAAGSGRSSSAGGRDLAAVRAWANEQGMAVSERGRLSKNVLEAYDAAHS
jgi:hypothetical protein